MSESLTLSGIPELLERLQPHRMLLTTHLRPDGDAMGSLCGLMLILRGRGFAADAVCPAEVPDYERNFLPREGLLDETKVELADYDLLIALDASRRDRISARFAASGEKLPMPMLVIDHHPDNPKYGEWNCIVPDAAATAEAVTLLATEAGWRISPEAATHLLIGILTDSGSFRFRNTSPRTLRTAAVLMDAGGDYGRVIDACYFSKPENMARFEADLLCNHLQKACGGRFLYAFMSPELLAKYRIDLRNTEQVIEVLRSISGPTVVATFRVESGGFKCSLRSKDPRCSVGRIARGIGGGGHELAAGCTIAVPTFGEAEQIILQLVEKELNEKPS
ncbi:MAG: bifunctional oligoribonuclease/PAP phosphatase NrnA [Lentisphaeria bacterium]|nr:bifunctional oligoribonuclease/PAP phosphatase NrnA [Lentisphaeria bacterium]